MGFMNDTWNICPWDFFWGIFSFIWAQTNSEYLDAPCPGRVKHRRPMIKLSLKAL